MTWRILQGDCREVLATLPERSVQCCVTSPPYWGLRDYGVAGQLGLETTPEEYVANMVEAFREVRRVLRDDATLWLNLGDSYCAAARGSPGNNSSTLTNPTRQLTVSGQAMDKRGHRTRGLRDGRHSGKHTAMTALGAMTQPNRMPLAGLKPKDLVGVPWRVAFALQADGWWLRSDIVWSKPNQMPESVQDRPTKSHEYVFLLAKSEHYYYDAAAIREPCAYGDVSGRGGDYAPPGGGPPHRGLRNRSGNKVRTFPGAANGRPDTHLASGVPWQDDGTGRNRRSVWSITTKPFSGAHFAVMPPDLAEICIRAGSAGGGLVLDPFAGAGTVGLVADRLGRDFVGVELNPTYAAMARERIRSDAPLLSVEGA